MHRSHARGRRDEEGGKGIAEEMGEGKREREK